MKKIGSFTGLILSIVLVAALVGCIAPTAPAPGVGPTEVKPVEVKLSCIERLNDPGKVSDKIAEKKMAWAKGDVLVFRATFEISNPNQVWAKVKDLYFEVKVPDPVGETIVLAGTLPTSYIPPNGETTQVATKPWIFGGVLGSYILRGVGSTVSEAVSNLVKVWEDVRNDRLPFTVTGNAITSLPEYPELGTVRSTFSETFIIPKS